MAIALGMGLSAPSLHATDITFTGSSGSLASSASFSVSGTTLTVTLANTSSADALNNPDLLGAVFFDVAGNPSWTPLSGTMASGSHIYVGGVQQADSNIGNQWAYGTATGGPASHGISAVGYNLTYTSFFPGGNAPNSGGTPPDGLGYSLTSAGDNVSTGNGAMTSQAIIKNAVVFTFAVPSGFDPSTAITDLSFQYGTSLTTDVNVPGYPPQGGLPDGGSTMALLGLGLMATEGVRRRFMKG